jgi:hypothetical protein
MDIREALQAVIQESGDEYAATYVQAALDLGGTTEHKLSSDGMALALAIKHTPTGNMMTGQSSKFSSCTSCAI